MKKKETLTKAKIKKIKVHIKRIEKEIEVYGLKYEKSLSTSTRQTWKMGKKFIKLKTANKKLGIKWTEYLHDIFPYIKPKKAQRYMKLARFYSFPKFPALAFIPVYQLEGIIDHYKISHKQFKDLKDVVDKFITDIGTNEVPDSAEQIAKFKEYFKGRVDSLGTNQIAVSDSDVVTSKDSGYKKKKGEKLSRGQRILKKKKEKKSMKMQEDNKNRNKNKTRIKTHPAKNIIDATNSATKTLVANFDLLINKRDKIDLPKGEIIDDLDRDKIEALFDILKKYLNLCN